MDKVIKDYDCEIMYHPGKANKVTDALSHKLAANMTNLRVKEWNLLKTIANSKFKLEMDHLLGVLATLRIEPRVV